MPEQPLISKSKYLFGLQCPKLLWHAYRAKDLIPEPDALAQAVFDQGHEVGNLAKRLFPGGIEVGLGITDLRQTVALTRQALQLRRPLFEAAFTTEHAYARVDILNPVGADRFDLYEVKSSTMLKPVYLHDLALQVRVLRDSGIDLRRYHLVHIDNEYVRCGDIDPNDFFIREDVTERVDELLPSVESNLDRMHEVIRASGSGG